jgi:OOP family OmpA-OmpF porin
MGPKFRGMALAALFGFSAANAAAQDEAGGNPRDRGPYIGLGAGANFQQVNRFRGGVADGNEGYNAGYVGLLGLGYAMGNGLRFELEPGFRHNSVETINGVTGHGSSSVASAMVNGIYDLNLTVPFLEGWHPHVGLGLGAAQVSEHSAPHAGVLIHGQDTVLAAQAIAGIEYAVSPAVKLGLDYRYFLAHNASFRNDLTGARVKGGDYNDHALLLTFRFQFGAPPPRPQPAAVVSAPPVAPPAAPAPPPPAVAHNYTVFFDWDKATLSPTARDIVRQAAATVKADQTARISVTGHTDTSGGGAYNQRLSERRAAAVRASMIAEGVAPDEITTAGRGKDDLAVPTADGVREPRNRRVVIVIQGPGV